MSKAKLEWKIGLFMLVAIVLAGGLLLSFSKGASVFAPTYNVRLRTSNIGGLIRGAKVVLAGVPVGSVSRIELDPSGKSVVAVLRLYNRFQIHSDASFFIEQAGFLGDQYVFVKAEQNQGPMLKDGDEVVCKEPFNFQEAARSALTLIQRVDHTVQQLDEAFGRVNKTLLAEGTLNSLTTTITNFRTVSDRTLGAVTRIEQLIDTNTPSINRSVKNVAEFSESLSTVTNLVHFTDRLNKVADELHLTIAENRGDVREAVKNIDEATISAKALLKDLEAGKGLAGGVLRDEELKVQFTQVVSNMSILSSNLNRFGLLYKPKSAKSKPIKPSEAVRRIYPKANQ